MEANSLCFQRNKGQNNPALTTVQSCKPEMKRGKLRDINKIDGTSKYADQNIVKLSFENREKEEKRNA